MIELGVRQETELRLISTQIYNSEPRAESGAESVASFIVAYAFQTIRVR